MGWRVYSTDILRVPGNYAPRSLQRAGGIWGKGQHWQPDWRRKRDVWIREWGRFEAHVRNWEGYPRLLDFRAGVVRDTWGELEDAWPWQPVPDVRAVTHYLLQGHAGAMAHRGQLDHLLWWLMQLGGTSAGARAGIHWLVTRAPKFVIWAIGPGLTPGILSPADAATVLKLWEGDREAVHPNAVRPLVAGAWYKAVVRGAVGEVPGACVGRHWRRWSAWDSLEEKRWWLCGGPHNDILPRARADWETGPRRGKLPAWTEITELILPGPLWGSWNAVIPDRPSMASPPPWLRAHQRSPKASPRRLFLS